MKKNGLAIITAALILGGMLIAPIATRQSKAAPPPQQRGVVILQGYQLHQALGNNQSQYIGIGVYCSSSSSGAPQFPGPVIGTTQQPISMAEAMAQLLAEGYHFDKIDGLVVYASK